MVPLQRSNHLLERSLGHLTERTRIGEPIVEPHASSRVNPHQKFSVSLFSNVADLSQLASWENDRFLKPFHHISGEWARESSQFPFKGPMGRNVNAPRLKCGQEVLSPSQFRHSFHQVWLDGISPFLCCFQHHALSLFWWWAAYVGPLGHNRSDDDWRGHQSRSARSIRVASCLDLALVPRGKVARSLFVATRSDQVRTAGGSRPGASSPIISLYWFGE
jgi:hypothetical protein